MHEDPMSRERNLRWEEMSIRDILTLAITDENEACDYYRQAAERAVNPHTRNVLLTLAEMEEGHAATLQLELEELDAQRECETAMAD